MFSFVRIPYSEMKSQRGTEVGRQIDSKRAEIKWDTQENAKNTFSMRIYFREEMVNLKKKETS